MRRRERQTTRLTRLAIAHLEAEPKLRVYAPGNPNAQQPTAASVVRRFISPQQRAAAKALDYNYTVKFLALRLVQGHKHAPLRFALSADEPFSIEHPAYALRRSGVSTALYPQSAERGRHRVCGAKETHHPHLRKQLAKIVVALEKPTHPPPIGDRIAGKRIERGRSPTKIQACASA